MLKICKTKLYIFLLKLKIIVLVVPFGNWDIRKKLEIGLKEDGFRYLHRLLEEIMYQIEKKKGEKVTQFVAILDSAGLTFYKIAHIESKWRNQLKIINKHY